MMMIIFFPEKIDGMKFLFDCNHSHIVMDSETKKKFSIHSEQKQNDTFHVVISMRSVRVCVCVWLQN